MDPQRVDYQRGRWYLTACDHDRADDRNFRLDRISGAVTLGPAGSFEARPAGAAGLPDEPWQLGDGDEVTARLLVDADYVAIAARQLGSSTPVEVAPDGSTVFSVAVTNWPAFRSFVLTFLDHAEVVGPADLRAQMVEWLRGGGPVSRPAASDRVARMLSLVPWVAARGRAPVDEICRRFDIDREQLLHDLAVVFMVGLYPYTPDVLIELFIDDDEVCITLPQAFDRPLSLTPEQGVALVAAGTTLLATPGADPDGPLARGLAKLASVLDQGDSPALQVRLEEVPSAVLDVVQQGVREHRQVSLDYYAYGRDELTHRVVDPHRVTTDQGQWYLSGFCHLADGDRLFRIDRIRSAELLASTFDAPAQAMDTGTFSPSITTPASPSTWRPTPAGWSSSTRSTTWSSSTTASCGSVWR